MVIIRLFLAAVALFVLIAVLAFVYLKWWQALLVCAAVLVAFYIAVRVAIRMFIRGIGSAVSGVFERRGEVLCGAAVQVHSVEPANTPASQQQLEDFRAVRQAQEPGYTSPEAPRVYYRIVLTIRPMPPATPGPGASRNVTTLSPAELWSPAELVLVPYDEPVAAEDAANVPPMVKMMRQFTAGYRLEEVTEPDDPTGSPEIGQVTEGPRAKRFSFLVGVPAEVRELKFKYYGESFGHIVLPPV